LARRLTGGSTQQRCDTLDDGLIPSAVISDRRPIDDFNETEPSELGEVSRREVQTSEAAMATDEDSAKRRLAFQKSYSLEVSAIRSTTPTGRWNDEGNI